VNFQKLLKLGTFYNLNGLLIGESTANPMCLQYMIHNTQKNTYQPAAQCVNYSTQCYSPCPPIDSIMRLMTVWRITGKIIRTAITLTYAQL